MRLPLFMLAGVLVLAALPVIALAAETPPAGGGSVPDAPPRVRLVSAIDVGDFGAETLRIGDLDSDGQPDLVFVQCIYETREITCLTATDIHGKSLWRTGKPSAENGRVYCDLPVQVYDWDGDGRNEVLHVRQARYVDPPFRRGVPRERASRYEGDATLLVLDGRTGREKATLPLPAPADDSFLFADLTGRGRRTDLVVKDRYWNMWGVSHEGKVLWSWSGSPGHFPSIGDIDGDGRDEVFVGFALIDHDGKVIFSKDPKGQHQDACFVLRPDDGKWRLLFGNSGLHCFAADGTELWTKPMGEAQHIVAGRFRPDSPIQLVAIDRTPFPHNRDESAWAILSLHELDGREIWRREQPKGAWAIAPVRINWDGGDAPRDILIYGRGPGRPAVVYDGRGEIVDELPLALPASASEADRRADFYAIGADVWGDERDEVILFGSRGACIWASARPNPDPAITNETFYPGM
jgi:hypothetical protein